MMDFEEFKRRVAMEIETGPGVEGREVEIREILQNNGVRKFAVAMYIPGENASPLVYLEKHYESFRRGKSFSAVVQEIRKECGRHRLPEGLEALSAFVCWDQAREMLGIKVINYKENQELLEALPHRRFLDLAAVYHCVVKPEGKQGTALVTKSHMRMWGITQGELERHAYASHKRHSMAELKGLDEVMEQLSGGSAGMLGGNIGEPPFPVYVARDIGNVCGASVLLFPEKFRPLAERCGSDLYLLPSSIFEVIALPACGEEPRELAEMVQEINQAQVLPEERLSDNVYLYARESGEIKIAWEWGSQNQGKEEPKG